MGIALRRKTTATEPDLETQIADTRGRLIAIAERRAEAATRRDAKLIDDDAAGVEAAEAETAGILKEQERAERRLSLLLDKAAEEARHQQTKAHLDRIERVEALFDDRAKVGTELADALEAAAKALRRVKSINASIAASWGFHTADLQPCMLGTAAVTAIQFELYRLSADGESNRNLFPGARAPSITDARPTSVKPFVDELRDSAAYAGRRMREAPVPIARAAEPEAPMITIAVPAEPAEPIEIAPAVQPEAISDQPSGPPVYAYFVDMKHIDTAAKRTVEVIFTEQDITSTAGDPLGPMGPLGRYMALRIAAEKLGDDFAFSDEPHALRFDMKRLDDSINKRG